jgi:hypothetical protein
MLYFYSLAFAEDSASVKEIIDPALQAAPHPTPTNFDREQRFKIFRLDNAF